jgi:betaine-aldehyde dehydrogenase
MLKRVNLELGGKSAAIVLDDADIATVAATVVPFGLAFNNGQACAALTRVLAPRSRYEEIVEAIGATVRNLSVGDPHDPDTQVGPLIAERQRTRVEGFIASGLEEGAKIAIGGGRPAGLNRGWYVEPTLFFDVRNDMKIAREEIFGPVGVVIPYDGGAEEALAIANDSDYGLAGAVFTKDATKGYEVASRVCAGTVGVNTFYVDFKCPFGGFKGSGVGREMGPEGLHAFQELKSVFGVPESLA